MTSPVYGGGVPPPSSVGADTAYLRVSDRVEVWLHQPPLLSLCSLSVPKSDLHKLPARAAARAVVTADDHLVARLIDAKCRSG